MPIMYLDLESSEFLKRQEKFGSWLSENNATVCIFITSNVCITDDMMLTRTLNLYFFVHIAYCRYWRLLQSNLYVPE